MSFTFSTPMPCGFMIAGWLMNSSKTIYFEDIFHLGKFLEGSCCHVEVGFLKGFLNNQSLLTAAHHLQL